MKIKTSELSGAALDWAVAMAEGRVIHDGDWYGPFDTGATLKWAKRNGRFDALCELNGGVYRPSDTWNRGGPIIERERIRLDPRESVWHAQIWSDDSVGTEVRYAPTALVAAMRCYAAYKLGAEVDVPKELL